MLDDPINHKLFYADEESIILYYDAVLSKQEILVLLSYQLSFHLIQLDQSCAISLLNLRSHLADTT